MVNPKAIEVKPNIYWTGVLDYDIRVFDIVMYTEYGTTYNAYLIKGKEKIALIEIAKEQFFDEFLARVKEICDPAAIDYIITNHTEPDHSGSLARLLAINPDAEIIGSQSAIKFLRDITNMKYKERVVKEGDTLDLGGKTLRFIMAPFLHWPDTMYTYCEEDKVLFTCDSFGCHYCSDKIFNDAIGEDFLDAYQYYFDVIMGPFKPYVLQALDKIKDLPIEMICTGHGPVLRANIPQYMEMYRQWAAPHIPERPSVAIPYVTSYGYTRKLAESIADGVRQAGDIDVALYDLVAEGMDEAVTAAGSADGILIGSPTLIGDTLPPIWKLLAELNPVIHKGKLAGAFGSYGWSGEAIGNIEDRFKQLRFKVPLPGLKVLFNPDESHLQQAVAFGKSFGEEVDKTFKAKYNK